MKSVFLFWVRLKSCWQMAPTSLRPPGSGAEKISVKVISESKVPFTESLFT